MIRVLDEEAAKPKVKEVRDFAERAENHFIVGSNFIPGDDPRYVCHLDTFRCVFTISKTKDGGLWRHLSISVPSKLLPNPYIAFTIAQLFGFTGWNGTSVKPLPHGWAGDVNRKDNCLVLAQLIPN